MSYGYMRHATEAYQENSIRGSVEGADPHQLTAMLLEGAMERMTLARGFIIHGNVSGKGSSISRALAIVAELSGSLDYSANKQMADRLESLYGYVTRRLLQAQLNDDVAALDECLQLLGTIREGWHGIRPAYLAKQSEAVGVR